MQQASKVEQGVIVGVRKVAVQAAGTTGAVVGGAAGGIAGSQAPVGSIGTALTTLGGTLVGGLVGTGIERAAGDTFAYEYIVRKGNGELVSVTQKDETALPLGQKVLVIAGSQARIVGDYTAPAESKDTAEVKPGEVKPGEVKPGEVKPGEVKPGEVKPAVPMPVSSEPLPAPPSVTFLQP